MLSSVSAKSRPATSQATALTQATRQHRSTIPMAMALPMQGRTLCTAPRQVTPMPRSLSCMYCTPAQSARPAVTTGRESRSIRSEAPMTVCGSRQICRPNLRSAYM